MKTALTSDNVRRFDQFRYLHCRFNYYRLK